jgi:hypothetical protein
MELEAKGIIIDKSVDAAEVLQQALLPEIRLLDVEVRRTVHKAIQSFRESAFEVCLVSDAFPVEELEAFFKDVRLLQKEASCVFVQVKDSLEGTDRSSLVSKGFATIITRKATDGDKHALHDVLKELCFKNEIKRKRVDVDTAIKLLMLEIDRVCRDRKRGLDRKFSRNLVSDFVTEQVDFHLEILDAYFKALETYSDKGTPDKHVDIELPRSILDLNLPGFVDGTYSGTSLRVWDMLRDKYGKPKEGAAQEPVTPPAEVSEVSDDLVDE